MNLISLLAVIKNVKPRKNIKSTFKIIVRGSIFSIVSIGTCSGFFCVYFPFNTLKSSPYIVNAFFIIIYCYRIVHQPSSCNRSLNCFFEGCPTMTYDFLAISAASISRLEFSVILLPSVSPLFSPSCLLHRITSVIVYSPQNHNNIVPL